MKIQGSRFWIATAAGSLFGTTAAFLTAVASEQTIRNALHVPVEAIQGFIWVAFLGALGASFTGFWSMLAVGVKDVGAIEVGGHRFPGWVQAVVCILAYLAPWTLVLAAWLTVMAVGI
jgi:hypothetical protein